MRSVQKIFGIWRTQIKSVHFKCNKTHFASLKGVIKLVKKV